MTNTKKGGVQDLTKLFSKDRCKHTTADADVVSGSGGLEIPYRASSPTGTMREVASEASRSLPFQKPKYFGSSLRARQ